MAVSAGRALNGFRLGAPANKFFKSGPAVVASIFEDRHVYNLAGFRAAATLRVCKENQTFRSE